MTPQASTASAPAAPGKSNSETAEPSKSAALFERAKRVLPGGVSRNTVLRSPHPAYAAYGKGCRVTDIDGVTRIDFSNNMAGLVHGHAYAPIVEAVKAQVERGSAFMLATEAEVIHAEHMVSRSPGFGKIRFVNSGTEAVMGAIKAARAFTGKPKIAKAEGAYHGGYDYAETSQTAAPSNWGCIDHPNSVPVVHGSPKGAMDDVVVFPFNDVKRTLALLDANRDQLACVMIDLMPHRVGLHPADDAFVHALREWTSKNGVLLLLDEVITFRTEVGGLQQRYGITGDITTMGKVIGGGFPVGAIAGRDDIMDIMDPSGKNYLYPLSGTYSANPITMTAGYIAMRDFDAKAVARLNALGDRARAGIEEAIKRTGACACVAGAGSMFRVHMKPTVPHSFREAHATPEESARLKALLDHLHHEGFIMVGTGTGMLSTPMTETEVDALVGAIEAGLR